MGVKAPALLIGGDESVRACDLFALPAFLCSCGLIEKLRTAWGEHCGLDARKTGLGGVSGEEL